MLHRLIDVLRRPGGRLPRGVHFHLGEDGREFVCHELECNPANHLPHLRLR
jgi:hypothetical protein